MPRDRLSTFTKIVLGVNAGLFLAGMALGASEGVAIAALVLVAAAARNSDEQDNYYADIRLHEEDSSALFDKFLSDYTYTSLEDKNKFNEIKSMDDAANLSQEDRIRFDKYEVGILRDTYFAILEEVSNCEQKGDYLQAAKVMQGTISKLSRSFVTYPESAQLTEQIAALSYDLYMTTAKYLFIAAAKSENITLVLQARRYVRQISHLHPIEVSEERIKNYRILTHDIDLVSAELYGWLIKGANANFKQVITSPNGETLTFKTSNTEENVIAIRNEFLFGININEFDIFRGDSKLMQENQILAEPIRRTAIAMAEKDYQLAFFFISSMQVYLNRQKTTTTTSENFYQLCENFEQFSNEMLKRMEQFLDDDIIPRAHGLPSVAEEYIALFHDSDPSGNLGKIVEAFWGQCLDLITYIPEVMWRDRLLQAEGLAALGHADRALSIVKKIAQSHEEYISAKLEIEKNRYGDNKYKHINKISLKRESVKVILIKLTQYFIASPTPSLRDCVEILKFYQAHKADVSLKGMVIELALDRMIDLQKQAYEKYAANMKLGLYKNSEQFVVTFSIPEQFSVIRAGLPPKSKTIKTNMHEMGLLFDADYNKEKTFTRSIWTITALAVSGMFFLAVWNLFKSKRNSGKKILGKPKKMFDETAKLQNLQAELDKLIPQVTWGLRNNAGSNELIMGNIPLNIVLDPNKVEEVEILESDDITKLQAYIVNELLSANKSKSGEVFKHSAKAIVCPAGAGVAEKSVSLDLSRGSGYLSNLRNDINAWIRSNSKDGKEKIASKNKAQVLFEAKGDVEKALKTVADRTTEIAAIRSAIDDYVKMIHELSKTISLSLQGLQDSQLDVDLREAIIRQKTCLNMIRSRYNEQKIQYKHVSKLNVMGQQERGTTAETITELQQEQQQLQDQHERQVTLLKCLVDIKNALCAIARDLETVNPELQKIRDTMIFRQVQRQGQELLREENRQKLVRDFTGKLNSLLASAATIKDELKEFVKLLDSLKQVSDFISPDITSEFESSITSLSLKIDKVYELQAGFLSILAPSIEDLSRLNTILEGCVFVKEHAEVLNKAKTCEAMLAQALVAQAKQEATEAKRRRQDELNARAQQAGVVIRFFATSSAAVPIEPNPIYNPLLNKQSLLGEDDLHLLRSMKQYQTYINTAKNSYSETLGKRLDKDTLLEKAHAKSMQFYFLRFLELALELAKKCELKEKCRHIVELRNKIAHSVCTYMTLFSLYEDILRTVNIKNDLHCLQALDTNISKSNAFEKLQRCEEEGGVALLHKMLDCICDLREFKLQYELQCKMRGVYENTFLHAVLASISSIAAIRTALDMKAKNAEGQERYIWQKIKGDEFLLSCKGPRNFYAHATPTESMPVFYDEIDSMLSTYISEKKCNYHQLIDSITSEQLDRIQGKLSGIIRAINPAVLSETPPAPAPVLSSTNYVPR